MDRGLDRMDRKVYSRGVRRTPEGEKGRDNGQRNEVRELPPPEGGRDRQARRRGLGAGTRRGPRRPAGRDRRRESRGRGGRVPGSHVRRALRGGVMFKKKKEAGQPV